jgi:hypothetical protein
MGITKGIGLVCMDPAVPFWREHEPAIVGTNDANDERLRGGNWRISAVLVLINPLPSSSGSANGQVFHPCPIADLEMRRRRSFRGGAFALLCDPEFRSGQVLAPALDARR